MSPVVFAVLLLALTVPSIVMLVGTKQAAAGTLGRNGSMGIRIRPVTETDENWVKGHKAAMGAATLSVSLQVVLAIVGIAAYVLVSEQAGLVVAFIMPMVMVGTLGLAVVKARAACS